MLTTYKPKLIEVALPLATINAEASREKSIRHGHPSTLHLWWARRPLAATRAVIWASLVDDPSGDSTLTVDEQGLERARLFRILERLVKWENSNDKVVLAEAKAEIERCFPNGTPPVLDPFGGGGAIPLEAQRLGLKALAGDLNPVSVLVQKAMIEIPPRFAGRPPVHPEVPRDLTTWERAQGLAIDVDAYGTWMREQALNQIGYLYPDVTDANGEGLTPIAWIWARTVESPDPSWHGQVPLVASWTLSNRPDKVKTWVEPILDREMQTISYRIREGGEPTYERTCSGGTGVCLATGSTITTGYIKAEGKAGRIGRDLIAIVAEGPRGRAFVAPSARDVQAAQEARPLWLPDGSLPEKGLGFRVQAYGIDRWSELFTSRQLVALSTFSDLLAEVHSRVLADANHEAHGGDDRRLRDGGAGPVAYADAVVTYLAFTIDKCADYWSTVCTWISPLTAMRNTFGRNAIPMTWDFAEANPFSSSTGNWMSMLTWVCKALTHLPATGEGHVLQSDARASVRRSPGAVICTDPPYYDNVGYADLSDFFYVWLRRNLTTIWPDECATLLTPKADEMIADPGRHGGPRKAERHFESGMAEFMSSIAVAQNAAVPATIFYAYKATETRDGEIRSTGWATFLQAVIGAGLEITATWPVRTEFSGRIRATGSNALASSIVLACRSRPVAAPLASRREFIGALRNELPEAVRLLQSGNIAPVDIAQSTIGPGIRVFSRYSRVVEADGSAMSVSDALARINEVLGEVLDGEEAELDPDTRFASTWYAQHGYNSGSAGDADGQARAKNTSLTGIQAAGIGEARAGKFRLFQRSDLDPTWSALTDTRLTVWEATQHLVAALERSESEAAELLHQLGGYGDRARQLAYVLFQKASDRGWADEAGAYNGLIAAWPTLQSTGVGGTDQQRLL